MRTIAGVAREGLRPQRPRPLVVLVDDDEDYRAVVREWLQEEFDTVSVSNGEELLDELSLATPDVLILDLGLPGPDGFALCARLRGDERFERVPVLFLTASGRVGDFVRGLESGGTAYLTKPVGRRALIRQLRQLLGGA